MELGHFFAAIAIQLLSYLAEYPVLYRVLTDSRFCMAKMFILISHDTL